MPAFSTTTVSNRVVASVLMVGSLQAFFTYNAVICCGMSSVTLLGERDDWQRIYERLDKMTRLGDEPATFVALLKPILRRFVASFDGPAAPDIVSFWARAVDRHEGSGTDYCSGWISAFCLWNTEGKRLREPTDARALQLDDVRYHLAHTRKIPNGFLGVPITINDNGDKFEARMVAGSVGIKASIASRAPASIRGATIEPVTGWWIFSTKQKSEITYEDPDGYKDNEQYKMYLREKYGVAKAP